MGHMDAACADKVAVIGSGSWGTAVSGLLSPHVHTVAIWSHEEEVARGIQERRHNPHQLSGYTVEDNVSATCSMEEALRGADAALIVTPSAYMRAICAQMAASTPHDMPLLILTKGVERGTGCLMTDIVEEELGNAGRIAVLSGPNHAEEISTQRVSASVVASKDEKVAEFFQGLLVSHEFRVYVTSDVVGVEICAAEKNVIAIACGIAAATGAGDNTLAALMTRGIAEISRLVAALGGDPLTCMGLAGMGDLVVTCTSRHSRNRTFGEAFVSGESLSAYETRTGMVVEGAEAARSVVELARSLEVQVPITQAVYDTLFEGMPVADAVDALLGRIPHVEFYGTHQERN